MDEPLVCQLSCQGHGWFLYCYTLTFCEPTLLVLANVMCVVSPRPISTSHLHALLRFQFWPINPIVCRGSYPLKVVRILILEQASRLDAFSGYPFRT